MIETHTKRNWWWVWS